MTYKNLLLVLAILFAFNTSAQKNKPTKYPSLMWEITGNGLKKPSYLFGTMHVSSKTVFHLSDSFYTAIKNCDAVSLELNPETWQPEMFRMDEAQEKIKNYTGGDANDYIKEKSFRLEDYYEKLKHAINEEPTLVNGLLYRTYQGQADFEENTYLDLYIYQTGRKLGKKAAGVEDYFETEKLMLEAYQDMAKEKKKKTVDMGDETYYTIQKKLQDAYKRGDLDLLDSLNKLTNISDAFTEKFLYKRNDIQANSIDTILKKQTLFVGVGAAHLPGDRGVIELLRKKGYKLRPIKMLDRDAEQKEKIDKLKVPVFFNTVTTNDNFIELKVPGKLYNRGESRANKSWQYADMENGTYYMITRVKTHAALLGQNEETVYKKIDSLLYENIPGKILTKKAIVKNNYKGYDITNKTRRGDIQRYNIITTPFEVLVFKMSGNDDYVTGKEADDFFNSINLKEQKFAWSNYQPQNGGFQILLPQQPSINVANSVKDGNLSWEYEANDINNDESYAVWKKTVHNYKFLEEDTFDLSLIEESIMHSEIIEKQTTRKLGKLGNNEFLDMQYTLKSGGVLFAKAFIKGANQYLLLAKGKKKSTNFDKFFSSFKPTNFVYPASTTFTDTSYKFSVTSPVVPRFDEEIRDLMEKAINAGENYDYNNNSNNDTYSNYPKSRIACFKNDTTGEKIFVTVQTFPKYFFSRDTARFWKNQLQLDDIEEDFIIAKKESFSLPDSVFGYKYVLYDTNSSKKITELSLLKDDRLYRIVTMGDKYENESAFVKEFFSSFKPFSIKMGTSVFSNKLNTFFNDYYSKDTATKKKANSAISQIYYGKDGFVKIEEAITKLKLGDKDYFDLKSKFIAELGYIDDSCCVDNVVNYLKDLYNKTADTSTFQNTILVALSNLKTKQSYTLLKDLLLQDPPVFEGEYGYNSIFDRLTDTLPLAKTFFPEILQLASLDDYKSPINNLLISLVDSGYLKANDYESYYSKLFFDAKIELKKQQSRDEKVLEKENNKDEDEENNGTSYKKNKYDYEDGGTSSLLNDYSILLMPYYDKNIAVQKFFDKLLVSKDEEVRLSTAIILLRNKHKVADSIIENLAAKDNYRAIVLQQLEDIDMANLFPTKYKNQVDVARAILLNDKGNEKFYAIEFVNKKYIELKKEKGFVYFFKYKIKKDDEWKMGISGLQPASLKEISSNNDLVEMTDKKFNTDETIEEQFEKRLKKLVFAKRKSAQQFFLDNYYNNKYGNYEE